MEFFQHENQSFPTALSDKGNLQSCQKSQLVTILETHVTPPDTEPEASFIILDRSAFKCIAFKDIKDVRRICSTRGSSKSSRIQLYLHEKILCLMYTGLLV